MSKTSVSVSFLLMITLALTACSTTPPPAATQAPAASQPTAANPAPTQPPAPTQVPAATEAPAAPAAAVLKIANTAAITTWDPIKSFSTEAAYMANVYEQLLRLNPPGSADKFTPLLATSWDTNADGKVWTFHLRENVKFHDGEPLTADAVKQSIEAAKATAGASFIWAPLDSIEVVDPQTVKFNLTYAAPLDLIASSLYGAWIVSPKALAAANADDKYFEAGVEAGTGPYKLESYKPDQEIVFTRDEDYWGGWKAGQFDKVLVTIVSEAITQQQMLEGGQVDLVTRIPPENLSSFKDNPNYTYDEEPSFYNYVGFFNTLRAPLDNVKVRQALSYAIPYDDIIKIGAQGLGTQSRGPVPAGVWPWSQDVSQYTYDLAKAKQLLADAGHPGGKFSLTLTYASENDVEAAFAPLIKDSFAQVGVDVKIDPILFNQQWDKAKSDPKNAQDIFLLLYWPTYSDAGTDNLWSMFYGGEKAPYLNVTGFNLSYWKNDTYNKLLDEAAALTVTDSAKAQKDYVDAMNLMVDQAPGISFFDTKVVFVVPSYIQGFKYNLNYPFVQYFFYQLSTAK